MTKFDWPLMSNNINLADKRSLIRFIRKSDKFTNGEKVKIFEKKWSEWLGVKYSTFVNSGASALEFAAASSGGVKQVKNTLPRPVKQCRYNPNIP